jgi:hypothetical protein
MAGTLAVVYGGIYVAKKLRNVCSFSKLPFISKEKP